MVFTPAAENKFDHHLGTGHCSFSCPSGNVEYYTVKNQTGLTWYCVLWLRVISLYLSCIYKYLVRFLSVCSWPVTQIRTVLRLEKDINVTHCIETILLSCKPKFQYTKLWKGDSYAHFTAVWARVIYSSRSLRSHLKPPSFMVGDAQRILQLNEWTFRCTSLEFPFIWPLNVT